jgi:hypothetical protein
MLYLRVDIFRMIKKRTALFFVFLANLIFLAQIVVSHHHHQDQVCIERSHCESDSYAHNKNTSEPDHRHDNENGPDFCNLKQAVIIPSDQVKQESRYFNSTDKYAGSIDFQAIIFTDESNSLAPNIVSKAQVPFITSSYSCFASTSLGLRAPPVC